VPTLLSAERALEVAAVLGEGPVWDDRNSSLLFVDIVGETVHRYHPTTGAHNSFPTAAPVGAVALRDDDELMLALAGHFARCGADGSLIETFGDFRADATSVRFNDGKVDPWGRFVAGTMDWNERDALGSLYQLSPTGEVAVLADKVTVSNGLDWSADRRQLFYVDSPTRRIDTFDVDPDTGTLSRRRVHLETDPELGFPDGLTIDVEGCIWLACWGGSRVCRFTPDGHLDKVISLPVARVSSVAFGGARLDCLYITTAAGAAPEHPGAGSARGGDLFVADPGTQGWPTRRFG
jgi:sugar lactone lactonase YvrE